MLADGWKSGVWLGKSDLTDEHLVRTDDGVVHARSVRRLAENSWSEDNLKAVVETPQKPRSMTTDDATDPRVVPEVHEQESQLLSGSEELVVHDIKEVEGVRQQEEQEDERDEELGDEVNGEVEEVTQRAHETWR